MQRQRIALAYFNGVQSIFHVSKCPHPKDAERTKRHITIWRKVNMIDERTDVYRANIIENVSTSAD